MSSPFWHNRRTFLRTLALGAGAAALTGCASSASPGADPSETAADYRLGPADQVRITVFNEPELTGQFVVGSQGTIAYPLVGNIRAAGLTVQEFTEALQTALAQYVRAPSVSVEV